MGTINNCLSKLMNAKNDMDRIAVLLKTYDYARKNSDSVRCGKIFEKVLDFELQTRNLMTNKYLLNPQFDFKTVNPILGDKECFGCIEDVLDYVALLTRNYLYNNYLSSKSLLPNEKGFNQLDLSNLCRLASIFAYNKFKELNIISYLTCINPGFGKAEELIKGYGHHFIVIVSFENKKYLFDCTYKQFFETSTNLLEKLGIYGFDGCFPGIYMMMNESRKLTAKTLLEKGWIELTDVNCKNYFDGFALSFRNALYYEQLGKIDYITDYTSDDYIKSFMFSDDSQIKREGKENLGIQKRKLKTNLAFKTPRF